MLRPTTMTGAVPCATALVCAPAIQRTGVTPSAAQLAQLWIDPGPTPRDLFAGPASTTHVRPATDARFDVVKRDTGGFSIGVENGFVQLALRAGNYGKNVTARYVARIRQKIAGGLELQ